MSTKRIDNEAEASLSHQLASLPCTGSCSSCWLSCQRPTGGRLSPAFHRGPPWSEESWYSWPHRGHWPDWPRLWPPSGPPPKASCVFKNLPQVPVAPCFEVERGWRLQAQPSPWVSEMATWDAPSHRGRRRHWVDSAALWLSPGWDLGLRGRGELWICSGRCQGLGSVCSHHSWLPRGFLGGLLLCPWPFTPTSLPG